MPSFSALLPTNGMPRVRRSFRPYARNLFLVLLALGVGLAPACAQRVAAGHHYSLAIHADGTLWAWGDNTDGQLGDGTTLERHEPVQIGTATNWQHIVAGGTYDASFTVALRTDGTLWTWGRNASRQLGDGTTTSRSTPAQVGTGTWQSIAAGSYHTAAVRTDGTLWAWGANTYGQLGDGTMTYRPEPVQIGTASTWQSIAAGSNGHTVALRTDGTIWTWGRNDGGQLGDGTTTDRSTPAQVGTATNWQRITTGRGHTVAVRTDGTLWAWGSNTYGQLGDGTTAQRLVPVQIGTTTWQSVAAGAHHTVAVRTDGTLWAWGTNGTGQLGDATKTTRSEPQQVGTATSWQSVAAGPGHTVAMRTDGSIWAWGNNSDGQVGRSTLARVNRLSPRQVGTISTWQGVATGLFYSVALRADGTLWTWGYNGYGELGVGDAVSQNTVPVQVGTATNWTRITAGASHTAALRRDGTLWTWGANRDGELGDGLFGRRSVPTQVGTATSWHSIAAANRHTVALRTDGSLWGWGYNGHGQFGEGLPSGVGIRVPTQIGTATNWARITAGSSHIVALRTDGTLWTWGGNSAGQLGDGTTTQRNTPTQVGTRTWQSIAAGGYHTVAVRTDGTLWAWGDNGTGQLGDGTTTNRNTPIRIGTGTNWRSIAAGQGHTFAVRTDGTLWAWGSNFNGSLGDGTMTHRNAPVQVGTGTSWHHVSSSGSHTLAVQANGTLWTWGNDFNGQLGDDLRWQQTTPLLIYPLTPTATRASHPGLELSLVPNPAHDQVELPGWPGDTRLELFDVRGRRVRTGQGMRLALRDVIPGLYLLRATRPGQAARTARLVRE